MLERNASPIDTFEGVLSRRDVRTLKLLIALGEHFVVSRELVPLRRARAAKAHN